VNDGLKVHKINQRHIKSLTRKPTGRRHSCIIRKLDS